MSVALALCSRVLAKEVLASCVLYAKPPLVVANLSRLHVSS